MHVFRSGMRAVLRQFFLGALQCLLLLCCNAQNIATTKGVSSDTRHTASRLSQSLTQKHNFCTRLRGWVNVSRPLVDYVYSLVHQEREWNEEERRFLHEWVESGYGYAVKSLTIDLPYRQKKRVRQLFEYHASERLGCPLRCSKYEVDAMLRELGDKHTDRVLSVCSGSCAVEEEKKDEHLVAYCACAISQSQCKELSWAERSEIQSLEREHARIFKANNIHKYRHGGQSKVIAELKAPHNPSSAHKYVSSAGNKEWVKRYRQKLFLAF